MQHMENTMTKLLQPLTMGQGNNMLRPGNNGGSMNHPNHGGQPTSRPPPTCYGCGATGHYRNTCPQQQSTWTNGQRNHTTNSPQIPDSRPSTRPPPTCYNCGVVGHTRNRCPQSPGWMGSQQPQREAANNSSDAIGPEAGAAKPSGN